MLRSLELILQAMVSNPQARVGALPLLDDEQRQLQAAWNNTQTDYPRDQCIHQIFEAQAHQSPDAIALTFGDQHLSYRQLSERSNRLAHHLRNLGVGPDTLVCICAERSPEMIVGLLAILKAGGAYVPMDPSYPRQRLAYMLEDTAAPVLLTQRALRHLLPEHKGSTLCLDADWPVIAGGPTTNPPCHAGPDSLAYVMYTSGSTGKPKGVQVPHRGVVRLVHGSDYARFDSSRVFLQLAPISFDASTLEIWGALLHGARCCIYPGGVPSPDDLAQVLRQQQVTTLWLTATLFNTLIDSSPQALSTVQELLTGGEALSLPPHSPRPQVAAPHAAHQRLRAHREHNLHLLLPHSARLRWTIQIGSHWSADR